MKWAAWDIEITKDMTGVKDWNTERPLGISCAAVLTSDGKYTLFHGPVGDNGMYAPQMTRVECIKMLNELTLLDLTGHFICTWNGVGFDFRTLAEECGQLERCAAIAMGSIDPGFQMVCEKGYMIGLDKAAKGLGAEGKTEGMSGAKAPVMWAESREQQELCLEYVLQDVRATGGVIDALLKGGVIRWVSRKGNKNSWLPQKSLAPDGSAELMTARQCLQLAGPPRSLHRPEEYMEWMRGA